MLVSLFESIDGEKCDFSNLFQPPNSHTAKHIIHDAFFIKKICNFINFLRIPIKILAYKDTCYV